MSKKWDFNEKKYTFTYDWTQHSASRPMWLHLQTHSRYCYTGSNDLFARLQQQLGKNASVIQYSTISLHFYELTAADPYFLYIPNDYISAYFFLPHIEPVHNSCALALFSFLFNHFMLPNFVSFKQLLSFIFMRRDRGETERHSLKNEETFSDTRCIDT